MHGLSVNNTKSGTQWRTTEHSFATGTGDRCGAKGRGTRITHHPTSRGKTDEPAISGHRGMHGKASAIYDARTRGDNGPVRGRTRPAFRFFMQVYVTFSTVPTKEGLGSRDDSTGGGVTARLRCAEVNPAIKVE